jgi:mono/diheme cytochrome c family protein
MALVCGALLAFASAAGGAIAGEPTDAPVTVSLEATSLEAVRPLLVTTCLGCHDNATSAGGFSVEGMTDWGDRGDRDRLIRAHDRVKAGEMPPEQDTLPDRSRQDLVAALAECLDVADRADIQANGRVPLRRLNRHELEQSLRTLLELPDLDVADLLPEDGLRDGFPKSAEGLELSRLQFTGTLDAVDAALAAAIAPGVAPPDSRTFTAISKSLFGGTAYGEPEAMYFAKDSLPVGAPAADDAAVECAIFRSAYWPYHGYPAGFVAERPGRYRVRFRARAVLQQPDRSLLPATAPVPMTFRARAPSGPDVSGDVKAVGGLFDIAPEEADYETLVVLRAGQTIEWSPLGLAVPLARNVDGGPPTYRFPPPPPGGHRGVAVRLIEIVGPLAPDDGAWPPASHRILFGDLPIRASSSGTLPVEVVPREKVADARRLLREFAGRVFGREVEEEDLAPAEGVVLAALDAGREFTAAMLAGYRVILAAPEFLLVADPRGGGGTEGESEARALAARLSLFLWNDRPDAALLAAASEGRLADPAGLVAEADRLVDDPRFARFVATFTDYWLDLRHLRRDEPDARFFPEYRFDEYLAESLGRETRASIERLIREDLPIATLIDDDVLLVNDRLAVHYGLPPVGGSALRPVPRPAGSPRGGLLTQGAILKVTANGTSTSPVKRGAWVMARLLGEPPPPPPEKVPAVEPDIRGATSIRELLARHTADASCAACHRRFDPVGFALEAFDVCGGERSRVRGLAPVGSPADTPDLVTGIDRAGHDFAYRLGAAIDPAGALADGTPFDDIRGLKAALEKSPRQLARNLLVLWTAYATGAPLRFSDRPKLEAILDAAEPEGFRVRGLLGRFVVSPIFTGAIFTGAPEPAGALP